MLALPLAGALPAGLVPRRSSRGSRAARWRQPLASLPQDASRPAVELGSSPVFTRRPTRRASLAFSQQLAHAEKPATAPLTAVLGLGQAMVDFAASVDDAFLTDLGLEKGSRKLISAAERSDILQRLESADDSYACNAGGSLSNTLVALARLDSAAGGGGADLPLPVGLAGSVGGDALGDFYRAKMRKAGVAFVSEPSTDGTTGTVIVLTTPDAQRTMLSFLGTSAEVHFDGALEAAATGTQLLIVEGYLLEQMDTVAAITAAVAAARRAGALVALTCADVGVVRAHTPAFRAVLAAGVDVLFANAAEATELAGVPDAADAAAALAASASMTVVTDGSHGAYLATAAGGVTHVPAHWAAAAPVDTCGAGDAYAAGVLYSLLRGVGLPQSGAFGSRVASAVISRYGARLCEEDATGLAAVFEVSFLQARIESTGVERSS